MLFRSIASALSRPIPRVVAAAAGGGSAVTLDDIDRAIERQEFRVVFQPQLRLSDGTWTGVESLARWEHPERGLLMPSAFVALAEGTDRALPFTYEIVARSLEALARIEHEAGFRGALSVNVPPAALTDPGFPDHVLMLLAEGGVPGDRLWALRGPQVRPIVRDNLSAKQEALLLTASARWSDEGVQITLPDGKRYAAGDAADRKSTR